MGVFLDADERVTHAFICELEKLLLSTSHVGFWISFNNWFMGSRLRYGDAFRKLCLFRLGSGEYEQFPEDYWSHLDMEVHEHPILKGTTAGLSSPLEHHDYRGLKHYIGKHNEYSSWEANRHKWLLTSGPNEWKKLTKRQKFKYRNLSKWWLGPVYFLVTYIFKKGFMDGRVGLTFARFKMRYFDEIRLKIKEQKGEIS